MMQPIVLGVCGDGGHGPQTRLGWRKPYFPSEPSIPEGWACYRFTTRLCECCGNIDILKRVCIRYRAHECNFDGLPLSDPVIRGKSALSAEDQIVGNSEDHC
jgi:hypothetical protein